MENFYENKYDELANKLLSGEITAESAKGLAGKVEGSQRDSGVESGGAISGTLEYPQTASTADYFILGDRLHISDVTSGQEGLGGFSYLSGKISELAERHNVSHIAGEVWETNPALKIFLGKGFCEVKREYPDHGDGEALVFIEREA